MYVTINVRSNTNRDANGFYLVNFRGDHVCTDIYDLGSFLEVKPHEIEIMRIFSDLSPNDACLSYPTIYITESEMWFG